MEGVPAGEAPIPQADGLKRGLKQAAKRQGNGYVC